LKLLSDATGQRYTVSELAAHAGVSLASIKFYVRERLLPAADLSAPKKQYYDDTHLRRLVLIRALRELSRLPIDKVRRLVRALDARLRSPFELVASAVEALASPQTRLRSRAARTLRTQIYLKLHARGLHVRKDSATLDSLTEALLGLRVFQPGLQVDVLDAYLEHIVPLAEAELAANEARILAGPESAMVGAIVGTVLFEPMILALRRIAHEHFAKRSLGS
jgi:DNA-binding transcriptional MerR regulator